MWKEAEAPTTFNRAIVPCCFMFVIATITAVRYSATPDVFTREQYSVTAGLTARTY
eukprot:SAG25_NODE_298_length_10188_cov_5.941421_5_plen_56_part_00